METPKIIFEGQTTKGLAVQIRYPQRDDLHALWEYINKVSKEQTYLLLQGEEISLRDEEAWLELRLQQIAEKRCVMLLALHDAALVGVTEIDLLTGVKRHTGDFGISVASEVRSRGVGELLMRRVIDEAVYALPGLEIITLEVFGNNPVAISLYQKLGFEESGRVPGGVLHRGAHVDDVHMHRILNQPGITGNP